MPVFRHASALGFLACVALAIPTDLWAQDDCSPGDYSIAQQIQVLHQVLAARAPDPAAALDFVDFPDQKNASGSGWGDVLTDIENHLPASYGTTYRDSDAITHGHETTHGINSHLRNHHGPDGVKVNGFYVGDDRAVILEEPGIRKQDVAPYVPASLQESRYRMYISNRESWSMAWDDQPLYVFDEWTAYTNGSQVGVDQASHGQWRGGWRDGMMGTIEFTVYSFALAQAVAEKDPDYFSSNDNFRAFIAFQAERAMTTYREGAQLQEFRWDKQDAYYQSFLEAADAQGLRDFIRQTWGDAFFDRVIAGQDVVGTEVIVTEPVETTEPVATDGGVAEVEETPAVEETTETPEVEEQTEPNLDDQPWLRDGLPPPPWWRRRHGGGR